MTNPQQQFIADIYPGAKKLSDQSGSSLELILAQRDRLIQANAMQQSPQDVQGQHLAMQR